MQRLLPILALLLAWHASTKQETHYRREAHLLTPHDPAAQILIAVIVTLWINWAHFMSWASANSHEMMLATQGLAGREDRCAAHSHA